MSCPYPLIGVGFLRNYVIMNGFINLHEESFYLQGARDLLLRLLEQGGGITYNLGKDDKIYSDAVFKAILYNRESLVKFLQGEGWRYYDHQNNKKGKLASVKVKFN